MSCRRCRTGLIVVDKDVDCASLRCINCGHHEQYEERIVTALPRRHCAPRPAHQAFEADFYRSWAQLRKERGLCRRCNKPRWKGKVHCRRHVEQQRQHDRARYRRERGQVGRLA